MWPLLGFLRTSATWPDMRGTIKGRVGIVTAGKSRCCRGFTLMELLVVIATISLLVTILLPSLQSAKALARLAVCSATMHHLAVGNALYADDWEGFSVHGEEQVPWVTVSDTHYTGYDLWLFPTAVFDDDFANSKRGVVPAVFNRNEMNAGAQNICGAGQLMWDHYIDEVGRAIGCPQADFDEITEFSDLSGDVWRNPADYQYVMKLMDAPKIAPADVSSGLDPGAYWRNDFYKPGSVAHHRYRTNFMVRGPMFRTSDIINHAPITTRQDRLVKGEPKADSEIAVFVDHEAASSELISKINAGLIYLDPPGVPVPYWPRRHVTGLNVAYVDGHVALFRDENRRITWSQEGRFGMNCARDYHNGWALITHVYDVQQ